MIFMNPLPGKLGILPSMALLSVSTNLEAFLSTQIWVSKGSEQLLLPFAISPG